METLAGNNTIYDSSNLKTDKDSFLFRKRILFLGSSVTFGAASCEDAIPEYFAHKCGCLYTKEAVSGTTLVDEDASSYVSRLKNNIDVQGDYDLMICQLSTNDATKGLPLGRISDSFDEEDFDTLTITGAIEYIIRYVRENWKCPVCFYTGSRYASERYEAMVERLYEIAEKWDIGVLDLWHSDEFNNISDELRSLYMADPIHPTKAGYHLWWCPEMERQLKKEFFFKHDLRLWYKEPSQEWTDSLPIGNGRIGAMIFGGTDFERIALNEDTLWSGYPQDKNNPEAGRYYKKAVNLAREGKYDELTELIEGNMLGDYTESYLPLGNVRIRFSGIDKNEVTDYRRELDLNRALATTVFDCAGINIRREAFASSPDNALVMRLSADKKASVAFELSFDSLLKTTVKAEGSMLTVEGLCPSHVEPSYLPSDNPVEYSGDPERKGIRFKVCIKVDAAGGSVMCENDSLMVKDSDTAAVYVFIRSSFNGCDRQPFTDGRDYEKEVLADVEAVSAYTYEELLLRHLKDYKKLFKRVDFNINSDKNVCIPTDARLEAFRDDKSDTGLYKLLFQYGRYLLVSSSRKGTGPANLQGIWNEELRAPWSSNYTLNINTEMNYWLAENCNLSECHEPLFVFIKDISVNGAKTAKVHYGARGVVSHHNSDIWCISNPVGRKDKGSIGYAYWNMSFGWLCRHLFEHYEYTLDEDFLRERTYPMLKDAAEFYLDILVEDEAGHLIISPATSPENAYMNSGKIYKVSKTATMSVAIVREVFTNLLRCFEILKIESELESRVRNALTKLPQYRIGKRGNIMEWDEDYEDAELTHRHISHLYPLYPGTEITADGSDLMLEACKKTLLLRGDGGTGWSLGWKVNAWARLKDGNHAEKLLQNQLNFVKTNECNYSDGGGTYRNLFDAHPPFQIDGNFAASAGICEMLLQNENGAIVLLPALPDSWKDGYIKGICAKGDVTVDICFKDHKLRTAAFHAGLNCRDTILVKYGDKEWKLKTNNGKSLLLKL